MTKQSIKNRMQLDLDRRASFPLGHCSGSFCVWSNPWLVYEEMKRELPDSLSPKEYDDAIFDICKRLHI